MFNRIQLCSEVEGAGKKEKKSKRPSISSSDDVTTADVAIETSAPNDLQLLSETLAAKLQNLDEMRQADGAKTPEQPAEESEPLEPQYRWRRLFSFSVPGSELSAVNIEGLPLRWL